MDILGIEVGEPNKKHGIIKRLTEINNMLYYWLLNGNVQRYTVVAEKDYYNEAFSPEKRLETFKKMFKKDSLGLVFKDGKNPFKKPNRFKGFFIGKNTTPKKILELCVHVPFVEKKNEGVLSTIYYGSYTVCTTTDYHKVRGSLVKQKTVLEMVSHGVACGGENIMMGNLASVLSFLRAITNNKDPEITVTTLFIPEDIVSYLKIFDTTKNALSILSKSVEKNHLLAVKIRSLAERNGTTILGASHKQVSQVIKTFNPSLKTLEYNPDMPVITQKQVLSTAYENYKAFIKMILETTDRRPPVKKKITRQHYGYY